MLGSRSPVKYLFLSLFFLAGVFLLPHPGYCGVSMTFPKSDALLQMEITQQIAQEPTLANLHFDINVDNGNVSVSGIVPKQQRANTLITLISSIAGVLSVDLSLLRLKDDKPLSADDVINSLVLGLLNQESLTGPLSREPATVSVTGPGNRTYYVLPPPIDIHVRTKDRVVYLSGSVPSQYVADNAINLARSVPGVVDVQSTLVLDTGPGR